MTDETRTTITLLCLALALAIPVAYWFGAAIERLRAEDAEPGLEPGAVVRLGGADYVLQSVHRDFDGALPETQVVLRDQVSHDRAMRREAAR